MFISSIFGRADDLTMLILGLASTENYLVSRRRQDLKGQSPMPSFSPSEGNSVEKRKEMKKADARKGASWFHICENKSMNDRRQLANS